ncbi:ferritin-like domain-containing protein [Aliiroseovarius sp. KMU-50]|uniref:Ferritin-like domain-containing protein n=1 Tax=Aliiroseovarius salicola TaxID=3009082 RepID=A0ABT4VZT8_9RHOB|nr:ferritin-like domain-containing protein [Aliiroseovarius sp. KMU-50]MDA5093726.1 ferritin-like domain-containing protein [Aliiroseovarius sp. KMU-50]
MAITNLESLRTHLQWAIELEHATLAPYLSALYSIKEGTNIESAEVIKSVFLEEMLHMALAANILNAVGGSPKFDYEGFIPTFPTPLPHGDGSFVVNLGKFSAEGIKSFLNIERPAETDAEPLDENYHSIGQFYSAITEGLKSCCKALGEDVVFSGDPSWQLTAETTYYGGAGHLIGVTDLASALAAMEEIVEQGEGMDHASIFDGDKNMFHPEREEVGHYFRFQEILEGRSYQAGDTPTSGPTGERFNVDWQAVHNMRINPDINDYSSDSVAYEKMEALAQGYSDMLRMMERAFAGEPKLFGETVGTMFELRHLILDLMELPSGDGATTVGPYFAYRPPAHGHDSWIEIRENGPYAVHGDIPLVRKKRVTSDRGEALTWATIETLPADEGYVLCRCGQSKTKPFCDGTHDHIDFDGEGPADFAPISETQEILEGDGIRVKVDNSYCVHAKYCFNKSSGIRKLIPESADANAKSQIIAMVDRCPSGTFVYELPLDSEMTEVEEELRREVAAISEDECSKTAGPLWVTGGVPIMKPDGTFLETRNRVTLCRCGQSKNKPFCDGTHTKVKFKE